MGSDVKTETGIPPFVLSHKLTVQIESHFLIGSFKIDHSLTSLLAFIYKQLFPVPSRPPIKSRSFVVCIFIIPCMRYIDRLPRRVVTAGQLRFKRRSFCKFPSVIDCVHHALLRLCPSHNKQENKNIEKLLHNRCMLIIKTLFLLLHLYRRTLCYQELHLQADIISHAFLFVPACRDKFPHADQ